MDAEICVVEWLDAFIDTDDFSNKSAEKTRGVRRTTVGFFVCEVEDGVVLATDIYAKKRDGWAGRLFIPWGMIEKYYSLEITNGSTNTNRARRTGPKDTRSVCGASGQGRGGHDSERRTCGVDGPREDHCSAVRTSDS